MNAVLTLALLGAVLISANWMTMRGPPGQAPQLDQQLIDAAARGDAAGVSDLLAAGASVTATDARGATALVRAAYGNYLDVAWLLVAAGADVNHQDQTKQSAYLISTSDGFHDLLILCLESGANVHDTDSYNGTGLIRAADRGHVDIVRTLLTTDIRIDHVNRLGWTALLEAVILGDGGARHTEVVRLLVEAGANVHIADFQGVTPLEHARRKAQTSVVAILEPVAAR